LAKFGSLESSHTIYKEIDKNTALKSTWTERWVENYCDLIVAKNWQIT
jgi:hypothetical protein